MSRYEYDEDVDDPYVIIEKHESSIGSFLAGALIGAGVALLFAPQSGVATRRRLGREAHRARTAAQDLAGNVGSRVNDTFQQARFQVETRIDTARQALELKKHQVSRAMEAGRAAAQQAREELERRIAETKAAYQAGTDVARTGTSNAGPAAGTARTRSKASSSDRG